MLSSLSVTLLVLLPPLVPRIDGGAASAGARGSVSARSSETRIASVLATASRYLGTRYEFGGATPRAFDCSGFVRYVFARHGIPLPRTAREQAMVGRRVAGGLDSLRAGDLLFFRTRRGRAAHVAIYVGRGRIIHASAGSRRVRYDDLDSARGRWFVTHLSGMRRVLADEGAAAAMTGPTMAGRAMPPSPGS
jgi:cell wall-associated NlpC family hydrolase